MSQEKIDILQRALKREKAARKAAEKILEEKSGELYFSSQKIKELLAEKSSQLQGIFENIVDAYVVMEINGDILKFNDSATKLFGYDIDKESINAMDLIHKEDYEHAFSSFSELQANGFYKDYETRIFTKYGKVKWVHVNGSIVFDKDKKPVAAQGIVRDITEIKNLELQKEKLVLKLEKSNDELHQYAHIVSHDLKSPLRSIDALVNWLKEDNLEKFDEASIQNISLIETTLEKMEQLISDVLNYSSVAADNSNIIDINTNTLVKELLNIIYIPNHIEIKICNTLPTIKGDKTKLQQVFQNLISNAIKFSDKEKGLIEIDFKNIDDFYQFSIKDNGIGVEKRYHERIFKIFHSVNNSKDSSGIGLSIVKKIVDLYGGEIWLTSEPNVGTTFFFTLKKQPNGRS